MTLSFSRRQALTAAAALPMALSTRAWAAPSGYDAVVRNNETNLAPGVPAYPNLSAAVAAAPADGRKPFRILISRGIWNEQVVVDKPFVHLVGEDRAGSVINHLAASGLAAPDGRMWGTFRTPTLFVRAPDFRAERLTINNAFDGLAEMTKPDGLHSHNGAGPQAVALMMDKGSDRAAVVDCDILSYQDTLFPDAGATLFERCLIAGSYDFIFGGGRAWFDRCEIRSRLRPADPVEGYITAPSTPIDQAFGFVFHECRLTKDRGVAPQSVFLGRPWRPSSAFPDGRYGDPRFVAAAAFLDCWMDDHIAPTGWTEMWYTGRDGNPRTMLQPEEVRFVTFGSRGPGRGSFPRGARLTAGQARRFRRDAVLTTNGG